MSLFSSRRPRSIRTNFTMISVMMVVMGVGLSFMSLRSINYKETEGIITESRIVRTGKGSRAQITYRYNVREVDYDNDTISYGLTMLRNKDNLVREYPAGQRVTVYYSITDPAYSVLEKGFSFASLGMMVLGAVLFVALRVFRT